jgi:hypothetical protein
MSVILCCETPDAAIYYTLDGQFHLGDRIHAVTPEKLDSASHPM